MESLDSNREPKPQAAPGHEAFCIPIVGGGRAGECPSYDPERVVPRPHADRLGAPTCTHGKIGPKRPHDPSLWSWYGTAPPTPHRSSLDGWGPQFSTSLRAFNLLGPVALVILSAFRTSSFPPFPPPPADAPRFLRLPFLKEGEAQKLKLGRGRRTSGAPRPGACLPRPRPRAARGGGGGGPSARLRDRHR